MLLFQSVLSMAAAAALTRERRRRHEISQTWMNRADTDLLIPRAILLARMKPAEFPLLLMVVVDIYKQNER
jgi:hypothetical protein